MKTIGLVMIVKNEEQSLRKCLSRAKKLVDEIYITDTGSTDDTLKIAEEFQAHISHFEWNNDFAAARNFALNQSDCDWNLLLDADEYLVSGKKKDLRRFAEQGGRVGAIRRYDSYREENGEISKASTYTTRFIPRGTFYEGRVHEQVVSGLPIAPLPLVFEHDGYLYGSKGERNLEILLEELNEKPEDAYILYQVSRTLWLMKEYERADEYFQRFYQLVPDTGTGYRVSGVISYLYNLLEVKKYEEGFRLIEAEKERLMEYADYHFACGTFYTKAILSDVEKYVGYLPEIEKSYKRCLEIGEVPEHEGVKGNGTFKAAYNLGVWFEVNGKKEEAARYYRMAKDWGYGPARDRVK
ncbi:MAG: glycosyltransferase family 2 protein [Lachnospiraceae bacterium]